MIHLGDITKISGYTAPVVDCIIGGSPCQDLSVAGKRAGLDGERSGLYIDQVRIVKEMRERDERDGRTGVDIRPRYMVWENVPGAFSSNKGEDFRIVLEELAKVADKDAIIPMPDKGKWTSCGCIMGDGWSISWRVLDAQFWGVPQRRRRIALVADFGGKSAPEILFVRKGVSGDIEPGRAQRKRTSSDAEGSPLADHREGVVYSVENHPQDSRVNLDESGKVQTLTSHMGTGGGNVPMVMQCFSKSKRAQSDTDYETWQESDTANTLNAFDTGDVRTTEAVVYALDRASFDQGKNAQFDFEVSTKGVNPPLVAKGPSAVCYGISSYDSNAMKSSNPHSGIYKAETARTLDGNGGNPSCNQGGIAVVCVDQGGGKSACNWTEGQAPTLTCTHGGEPAVCYSLQGSMIGRADENGPQGDGVNDDISFTLNTIDRHAVAYSFDSLSSNSMKSSNPHSGCREVEVAKTLDTTNPDPSKNQGGIAVVAVDCRNGSEDSVNGALQSNSAHSLNGNNVVRTRYIVRRLTPLECERLQGFPDGWTDIGEWVDSKGKKHQSSDAARYKALGNSIALPPWKWVLKRLCACYERDATMASLFDGIGGFPYLWEQLNGKGSCLWASEIEDFPIAVTKVRIGE